MVAEPAKPWQRIEQAQNQWPAFFADLDQVFLPPCCPHWPSPASLSQALSEQAGHVHGFCQQNTLDHYSAAAYEREIFSRGWVPTRPECPHDLFNALIWLRWPATKAALNHAHVRELERDGQGRNRCRDALTLLDEAGVVLLSPKIDLLEALAAHQWHEAWREQRQYWQNQVRCLMFGHGLLEQCLSPHIGLTAKALLVHVEPSHLNDIAGIDAWLADQILSAAFHHPHQLSPLPLLGVPGLWTANNKPDFYGNSEYFRPPSQRRPAAPVWRF